MTLEKLLNTLCEKGWKPFGYYDRMYLSDKSCVQYHKGKGMRSYFFVKGNGVGDNFTLRELVSKESLLWQFCTKNGMIKEGFEKSWVKNNWKGEYTNSYTTNFNDSGKDDYEYRVIESALCDEDKLEEFLLDNIKIDG